MVLAKASVWRVPLWLLQGLLAVLALLSGVQLLLGGASLSPEAAVLSDSLGLDGMLRFEGGAWAGLGLCLLLLLYRIEQRGAGLRAAWTIVLLGGLCHCLALARFGFEDPSLLVSAVMEVAAPLVLGVWQALLARRAAVQRSVGAARERGSLPLRVMIGLCGLLALWIGARALWAGTPLPEALIGLPQSVDLRGALHFVAGLWLGLGVVLLACVPRLSGRGEALRVACLVLFAAGLGRAIGIARYGVYSPHLPVIVALELALPTALCAWQLLARPRGPHRAPETSIHQRATVMLRP